MANAGADIFLILLRPTKVPIAGEAVSHLFQGQVLIESLSWNLHNEDESKSATKSTEAFSKKESLLDKSGSNELRKKHAAQDYERAEKSADETYHKALRNKQDENYSWRTYRRDRDAAWKTYKEQFDELSGKSTTAEKLKESREEEYEDADRNTNFEITFTKRVDIASTQMLNSMKAGDIFPSGTLTIHKRAPTVTAGTTLVFTIQKIRLISYRLLVEVTDTMTEMMEEWTCEFNSLAYVYKNPPSYYEHGNASQAVAKTLSQGTARAFTMKNIGSPI
jgi:type VI protein secretion system component Hcp